VELLEGVDVVLGDPWLKKHGVCLDFEEDIVKIRKGGKSLTLYSCIRPPMKDGRNQLFDSHASEA